MFSFLNILAPARVEIGAGGPQDLKNAAELLATAKNPVIVAGGGVVIADGVQEVVKLAEQLQAPVCTTYLHNDAFPKSHNLLMGPLGYQVRHFIYYSTKYTQTLI